MYQKNASANKSEIRKLWEKLQLVSFADLDHGQIFITTNEITHVRTDTYADCFSHRIYPKVKNVLHLISFLCISTTLQHFTKVFDTFSPSAIAYLHPQVKQK